MTGAQALMRALEAVGTTTIFGIPGGTILPAYDPLLDSPIRHILCRHEQGAAHAADGYAQASGRVGVCMATSGPGVTNLVTGLASAYMDSVPVVAVSGQVTRAAIGGDAFQECDATGITLPVTKHNWLVMDPGEIAQTIAEAFHVASTGRPGPVLVDIPKDVLQARFPYAEAGPVNLPGYQPKVKPNLRQIKEAAKLILASERPVIYAGGGIIKAGAAEDLRRLAELAGIHVVTTLMARGAIPDAHPLCLGMPGMHGNYTAVSALQRSDLLIALGPRFDDRVTGKLAAFAPVAKVIHADIDPAEISKNRHADVPIVGDAKLVIQELIAVLEAELATRPMPDYSAWTGQLTDWRTQFPYRYHQPEGGLIKPQYVIERLGQITDGNAIYASGVGQHQMWGSQFINFRRPRTWINSGGLGAMGFGVPAAMGAKVAMPGDEVWCIDGDGCFQMTCQELATMAYEKIPVKIAIVNNGYLGMVRQWQELFYAERYSEVKFGWDIPDYVRLAEAYGCVGLRAESVDDVDAVIEKARGIDDRPVVIDFRCDPFENCYPMVAAGASNDDIIMGPEFERDHERVHEPQGDMLYDPEPPEEDA
ncbi:MAG TPA: acetolactate synthase large subunit [Actinomycetota bacterium]|nr:acetolactate synthase large subunit [Actinomycetota bacterium]